VLTPSPLPSVDVSQYFALIFLATNSLVSALSIWSCLKVCVRVWEVLLQVPVHDWAIARAMRLRPHARARHCRVGCHTCAHTPTPNAPPTPRTPYRFSPCSAWAAASGATS
jgi:hypothetical protein